MNSKNDHIGKLTFEIDANALRQIISSGRLAEFAGKAGAHAAAQINSQVVDLVSKAAIDEGVPAPVLTAALYERFSSRGAAEFADKLLSAMRYEFGGHVEKKP